MNIGKSIKFIRVAANIKQGEMAKKLDVSQNYMSLLENNKAEPSLSLLKKISEEFNVPIGFLLVEENVAFESDNTEIDGLYKELHNLIYKLQKVHVEEVKDDKKQHGNKIKDQNS